jgi:Resolvase, N terminal domain
MSGTEPTPRPRPFESAKITDAHRPKVAVVYVRQSTPQQVAENRESLDRQYVLAEHARALGWPAERVLVIDADLGQSARTAEARLGFQRLLAEVSMDHVGLVLGLEMSRLSRSCKDWHQLLELCGLFGALLADQDGVYDPSDPNDRLMLGSEGTVRAFRAGATTRAVGTVHPLAKFATRRWCDERPGAVSCEDGDHRVRGRLTDAGGRLAIVRCVKGEYPHRINETGDVT